MDNIIQVFSIARLEAINPEIEQVLIANWCTRENIDRFNIKIISLKIE